MWYQIFPSQLINQSTKRHMLYNDNNCYPRILFCTGGNRPRQWIQISLHICMSNFAPTNNVKQPTNETNMWSCHIEGCTTQAFKWQQVCKKKNYDTVKCFNFAGSNIRGFQNWTYSWGFKFAVSLFICTMR